MKRDLRGIAPIILFLAVSITAITLISLKLDKKIKMCSGDFVFTVPSDFRPVKTNDLEMVFETDIEGCDLTIEVDPEMHCTLQAECGTMSSDQLLDGCTVKSEGYGITAGTDSYNLRVAKRSEGATTILLTDVLLFGDGVCFRVYSEVPEAKYPLMQQQLEKIYSTLIFHGPAARDSKVVYEGKYFDFDVPYDFSYKEIDGKQLRCAEAEDGIELRFSLADTKALSYARMNIYSVKDITALEYIPKLFNVLSSDNTVRSLVSDTTVQNERPCSHINYTINEGDCTEFDVYAFDEGGVCYIFVYSFPGDFDAQMVFRNTANQIVGGFRTK